MLAGDLIEQSRTLAEADPGKPKQVNLRRAISSAYYGLFHMLSGDSAWRMAPAHLGLRELFARSFDHGEMKSVCSLFAKGQVPARLKTLVPVVSQPLKDVTTAFVDLQAARHEADYNLQKRFSRSEAFLLIEQAEKAYATWNALPWNQETDTFSIALSAARKLKLV
jgi:uncharacterized protein (UPF0332 family)